MSFPSIFLMGGRKINLCSFGIMWKKLSVFWSVQPRRLSERAVDTRNCLTVKCVSPNKLFVTEKIEKYKYYVK